MHRRIKKSILYSTLIVVCAIVCFFVWRSSLRGTVIIYSVDRNGTSLRAPRKIIGHANEERKINITSIKGYKANANVVNAKFLVKGARYYVVYTPDSAASFQHLLKSKYVGVSSQDVTTNSVGGIQAVPYRATSNRLRVMYSKQLTRWSTLNVSYPKLEVQDPSLTKFGNYWYVTYTGGVLRSADFGSWEQATTPQNSKYGKLIAPSLVHTGKDSLSMVFTSMDEKSHYRAYITPFNYFSAQPDLKKARQIRGISNVNAISLYKGAKKYYAIFTKRGRDSGIIFLATSRSLQGKYSVIHKIVPPKGTYYYAPTFILTQSASAVGITYSSYFYNESNNLSYSPAFFKEGITGKGKAQQITGQFALQKMSIIKVK